MQVEFWRTDERRYSVMVFREGLPPCEIGGPGYDDKMPHDLQHFIVERELGLQHGIFGFLAAGGQTGGDGHDAGRAASRRRRKAKRRDQRMIERGERGDGDASEAAAFVCWAEWLRRRGDPQAKKIADGMATTVARMAEGAQRLYGEDALARVCACMDELSAKWSGLAIGEAFTVSWTTVQRDKRSPSRQPRRRAQIRPHDQRAR